MGENNFNGVVESLLNGMHSVMEAKTVVGQPTQVGDTIVLPLVDVSFGVGAGATSADKKNGGTGGFGAKMSPSAVLVIKNGSTKLVNIKNQDAVTKVLDLVPDIVDRFSSKKENIMDDEKAVDIAFPQEGKEE
ncbi:MAG: GerW family sporulation protein [Butyrivibrio sp.]|uniref:GerW family sporulation protein n=1 Tax=Butyrivibrio sp. TaxID=28121 RepID=UPI001AFF9FD6|nr:GerW family sporulation protein [Butyrivibrio sp.]MBO6239392.1 GerW family sporulation protein [Butyrivibrio sp.]